MTKTKEKKEEPKEEEKIEDEEIIEEDKKEDVVDEGGVIDAEVVDDEEKKGYATTKNGKKARKKGIVEGFLGGMPIFGDFFKELAKTETFQEKFKEVDEKIEENLRKGQKKKWGFEANISVRPIINDVRKDTTDMFIGEDYFYGKKRDSLSIAIKVPKEGVNLNIKGKNLLVISENFEKKIELPDYFKYIKKKKYKNGILVLELTK